MCGIFAYIGNTENIEKLQLESSKIKHRGPDITKTYEKNVYFKFHRLCICDKSEKEINLCTIQMMII